MQDMLFDVSLLGSAVDSGAGNQGLLDHFKSFNTFSRAAHPITFSLEFFRRVVILMYLGMLNPKIATKKLCKIWNNWLGGAKKTVFASKNHFFNIFKKIVLDRLITFVSFFRIHNMI